MRVEIGQGGLTYDWSHRRKPHVHPLTTPEGRTLTVTEPADHPWHRGLWFALKYVNGENYWEEAGGVGPEGYGVQRHVGPPSQVSTASTTIIEGDLEWIAPDRTTVAVRESRRLVVIAVPTGYAIDWTSTIRTATDAVLDRTPSTTWGGYGGLTLRGHPEWTDTKLTFDDGTVTDRVTPKEATWFDLSGTVDGASAGVTFIDRPTNPRSPTPVYASTRAATYGDDGWSNFLANAPLFHEPLSVSAGTPTEFRHLVVVHDGPCDPEAIAALRVRWLSGTI